MQGAGAAATWTSNLSILMAKFPERKSTVKAWCDAAFNFGLTIGPVLGALMYGAGGFFLPFAVTGTAILASGLVVMCVTEVVPLNVNRMRQKLIHTKGSLPKKQDEVF